MQIGDFSALPEAIRQNWVQFVVLAFLLGMLCIGYYRGMVKMIFSFAAVPLSLLITNMLTPHVQTYVAGNEALRGFVESRVQEVLLDRLQQNLPSVSLGEVDTDTEEAFSSLGNSMLPSSVFSIGESGLLSDGIAPLGMQMPESSVDSVYRIMGLDKLSGLLAEQLSEIIVESIVFLVLMFLVRLLLRILFHFLNQAMRLPGLNALNRGLGAVFGLVEAVIYLWIALLLIGFLPENELIENISAQFNRTGSWLWYLKEANLLGRVFLSML